MKTHVVNIDNIGGVTGLQRLIDNNPEWMLQTCGSARIKGLDRCINFAVFCSLYPVPKTFQFPEQA